MADEITVQLTFTARSGNLNEQRTSTFRADMDGAFGPSPGAISVTTSGTSVDLSQLARPGFCWLSNLEDDGGAYVEYGVLEPDTGVFYPVGEIQPGESYLLRLSRNVTQEYSPSTGTGTSGPTNYLHLKATGGTAAVAVLGFEA